MASDGTGDKQKERWRISPWSDEFQNQLTVFGRIFFTIMGSPPNYGMLIVIGVTCIGGPIILANGIYDVASYLAVHNYRVAFYLFIGVAVMLLSIVAYRIRTTIRFLYGLLEFLLGIVVSLLGADGFLTAPGFSHFHPTSFIRRVCCRLLVVFTFAFVV